MAEPQRSEVQEDDSAARKAALVLRMAQVGTALFPVMPSAKAVPQPPDVTAEVLMLLFFYVS